MQVSYLHSYELKESPSAPWVRAIAACLFCLIGSGATATAPQKSPSFQSIAEGIRNYFESKPGYRDGDLIGQSQIADVINRLAAVGWKVDNPEPIVALGLADSSFLIREFSSPSGKRFIRKIAKEPGGYAHLDRLSTIPRGQEMIRYLISKPGGQDLITYMATTTGGHNLGHMMTDVRGGVDLNKSTRRIYTVDDLIAALQNADATWTK